MKTWENKLRKILLSVRITVTVMATTVGATADVKDSAGEVLHAIIHRHTLHIHIHQEYSIGELSDFPYA